MDNFHLVPSDNGVWYGIFPALAAAGFTHGISARLGGVSGEPYDSLNLGLHTADESSKVLENRRRFAHAVSIDLSRAVAAEQVHGNKVAVVTEEQAGSGAAIYGDAVPGVDALVTNCVRLPLMLFFADCVPIIIADPVRCVAAISHAGWQGTVAGIATRTVEVMAETFQTAPQDCIAAVGPSIGPCCYEVDAPVIDKLREFLPDWETVVTAGARPDRWQLNLWEANRLQLVAAGLQARHIHTAGVCTCCNDRLFFSHRAGRGKTGRLGAVIEL